MGSARWYNVLSFFQRFSPQLFALFLLQPLLSVKGVMANEAAIPSPQTAPQSQTDGSDNIVTRLIASQTEADPDTPNVELSVIDSFIELHSGPGRGYPILNTIEQGETVHVYKRRGTWYLVSDKRLNQGWVPQDKLARTIASTGLPAALPDVNHGDYLAQKIRIGFSAGKQDDDETANIMLGYRLLSFASIEAEVGQIFTDRSDGYSYGANLLIEPIQSLSFTPFISYGLGKSEFKDKATQSVGSDSRSSDYHFWGAGINYYIGLNFVVRGEYRKVHLSSNNDSASTSAWRIGFSSFF